MFFADAVKPLLFELGIEWSEFRRPKPDRRSVSAPSLP